MLAALSDTLLGYDGGRDLEIAAPGYITRGALPTGEWRRQPANFRFAVGPARRSGALPLVSCLMPTKGRLAQAKLAIACFRRQSWPHRELVVLDQNPDERLGRWIATLGDASIRHVFMPGLAEPLGAIRNRTIDLARGDFLCVWDDDDLQHPARLEIAMAAISAAKVPCSLIGREVLWEPHLRRLGLRKARPFCNSFLAHRSVGLRYPPLPRGEDVQAVHAVLARHPAAVIDLPALYLYVVHSRNVSLRTFLDWEWSSATDICDGDTADALLARLAAAFPVGEYLAAVRSDDAATAAAPA